MEKIRIICIEEWPLYVRFRALREANVKVVEDVKNQYIWVDVMLISVRI